MSLRHVLIALPLIAVTLAVSLAEGATAGRFKMSGTVTRMVDGDTVAVRLASGRTTTVRLLGVDTPERGTCFATQATAKTRELAFRKRVVLVGDPTQATRDRYGRLLAYVLVNGRVDVGYQLVATGRAKVYIVGRAFARVTRYRAAETRAKNAPLGLWQGCAPAVEDPPPAPAPKPACSDGADNDGDRSTDYPFDPGCSSADDDSEKRPDYACDDGIDQDMDGATDFPADLDCFSVYDPTEGSPTPAPRPSCDPSYPDVCIPPPPPDLDCGEVAHRNFRVVGSDPHRFDSDGDGVGCEE